MADSLFPAIIVEPRTGTEPFHAGGVAVISLDPLDLAQWQFYVTSARVLGEVQRAEADRVEFTSPHRFLASAVRRSRRRRLDGRRAACFITCAVAQHRVEM